MDDVTNPEEVVNTPGETETPAPSTDGGNQTGGTETQTPQGGQAPVSEERDWKREAENLQKALKFERERAKRLNQGRGGTDGPQYDENVYNHPDFQKLALENATYQLKDGVSDILERYPNVPKAVASAIKRNPRGWVNNGTQDVQTALFDIEENLINYLEEEKLNEPTPTPKPVKIAGNNTLANTQNNVDVEVQRIMGIPPEQWSPEDEKIIDGYLKKSKS